MKIQFGLNKLWNDNSKVMFSFISDSALYSQVLELATKAKHNLWIGTADIKDLYISNGKTEKSFLGVLS